MKMVVGYLIVTNRNTHIAADNRSGGYPCECDLISKFGTAIASPKAKSIWNNEAEAAKYALSCHDQFGPLTVKPLFIEN